MHLQVGEVRVGERAREPLRIAAAEIPPALVEQLPVARHRSDVPCPVDHEEAAHDRGALVRPELVRGARRQLQEAIARAPGDVVLELLQQDRREVHGAADPGVALQDPRHVVVRAGGVEPDPGQEVLARVRVAVGRLVHVPEEREAGLLHRSRTVTAGRPLRLAARARAAGLSAARAERGRRRRARGGGQRPALAADLPLLPQVQDERHVAQRDLVEGAGTPRRTRRRSSRSAPA